MECVNIWEGGAEKERERHVEKYDSVDFGMEICILDYDMKSHWYIKKKTKG